MTAATVVTAPLNPVTVDCGGCGSQFLSRARRHVTVRCPRCGHGCRVLRAAPAVVGRVADDGGPSDDGDVPAVPSLATLLARMLAGPRSWQAPARANPVPARGSHTARPAPRALRPGAELAARNWRFGPAAPGCCEITEVNPHGWPGSGPWPCAAPARGTFGGGRVCDLHHAALTAPLVTR
jgi:hypothetical protein